MAISLDAAKNLVWSTPVSMLAGLLYGNLFDAAPLKQSIIPVTFIMVYPMMVTLNVKSVFKGEDYKLQIAAQAFNFILIPLLAYYTGKLFFSSGLEKHSLWAVGLFLIGVLPTSGMTISWTGFAKGNKAWEEPLNPRFPRFSALGVTLIAFVAMALKARNIVANPGDIVAILIPLAAFYLVTYVFLSIIGRLFFKREDAIAMVFGVVMRDLSIALAIAMTALGKQGLTIALLIALAYVIRIQ